MICVLQFWRLFMQTETSMLQWQFALNAKPTSAVMTVCFEDWNPSLLRQLVLYTAQLFLWRRFFGRLIGFWKLLLGRQSVLQTVQMFLWRSFSCRQTHRFMKALAVITVVSAGNPYHCCDGSLFCTQHQSFSSRRLTWQNPVLSLLHLSSKYNVSTQGIEFLKPSCWIFSVRDRNMTIFSFLWRSLLRQIQLLSNGVN